jgi:hypothetical protein
MTYKLELTKPANIRGSIHGKIDAYTDLFNFIANLPTNEITPDKVLNIISSNLKELGCKNIEVKANLAVSLDKIVNR